MSEPVPWVTLRLNVALKAFEACERVGAASCPAGATAGPLYSNQTHATGESLPGIVLQEITEMVAVTIFRDVLGGMIGGNMRRPNPLGSFWFDSIVPFWHVSTEDGAFAFSVIM